MAGSRRRQDRNPQLARLFRRHYHALARRLRAATGDPDTAEEAVQEAFARLLEHWHRIRDRRRLPRWLYVVALRYGLRLLRQRRRITVLRESWPAEHEPLAEVEDRLDRRRQAALLRRALARLPRHQRRLLLLRYGGRRFGQLAAALRLSRDALKKRIRRALRRLRAELDRSGPPPA